MHMCTISSRRAIHIKHNVIQYLSYHYHYLFSLIFDYFLFSVERGSLSSSV